MTCEVHSKEINSQCVELLVRPLYIVKVSFHHCEFHYCETSFVKNTCAGKRMGRHINIKHQNQTAFINLLNLCDQKFVSVITIS